MNNILIQAIDSGLTSQKAGKIVLILLLVCFAYFLKEPIAAKSNVYKIFREVSIIQMSWITRNWDRVEGPHFIVKYHSGDKKNAEMVLDVAEKNYKTVSDKFGYIPKSKTLIAIYPTKQSLGRSFGWAADESAMGVYWAGAIRILSPSAWVESQNPDKFRTIFENEGPVVHEYAHLMVDYITGGNYTRWFTEGVAQYEEEQITGYTMDHREIKSPDEMYALSDMDKNFDNLEDQSLAYYESLEAVNYIVDRYGEAKLNRILTNLGDGYNMEDAFYEALHVKMPQFEKDFKNWIVTQNQ